MQLKQKLGHAWRDFGLRLNGPGLVLIESDCARIVTTMKEEDRSALSFIFAGAKGQAQLLLDWQVAKVMN